jgi:hypothetical protein
LPTYSSRDGPPTALADAVTVGAPHPSSGSAREDLVRWISSHALGDQWQLGGGRHRHRGLLFIGEKRGRITYATGSLSLTDLVEFELDFSFGYFYKKNPKINIAVANFWI